MSDRRFSLTRVRLRQYRSIAGCDVQLGPLTFLVGANGSGKSNFLDALRLTAESLNTTLDHALRERGGIVEVRRRSTGHPTSLGVELHFEDGLVTGTYKFQIAAVRGGDFRVSHESCEVFRNEFGTAPSSFLVRDGRLVDSTEGVMPPPAEDRLYLVAAAGLPTFRPVFDGLAGANIYSVSPDSMRRLQPPDSGGILKRDGSNIAGVLERLRRERPDLKSRVEEYLRQIVDNVVAAERRALGSWETVEFRQVVAGAASPWTFNASSMSDGTLRALGVLVALFAESDGVYCPVGIEEPESALHPAAAGLLLDALRDATSVRQVLATSHSPDLLDSADLTPSEILAVDNIGGTTRIGRLDAAGQRALRENLYTPGELLRVNQLAPDDSLADQIELFAG